MERLPSFLVLSLFLLSAVLLVGCGSGIATVDDRDYLRQGGSYKEEVLFDGRRIGLHEMVFTAGDTAGDILEITLKSRADDAGGPKQITSTRSEYDREGNFIRAVGTIWTRASGLTTEFTTPEGTPEGPAAVTVSLLRRPLEVGERRTVVFYDLFRQTTVQMEMSGRDHVRVGSRRLLRVDAKLIAGQYTQTLRAYCDARGHTIRTDLDVSGKTMTIQRTP
ncbi:MAG TPA: hypothetical protein DEB39_04370 [Planctomycetaceae bacterium]|nr:hypothetical protein [Planctomycetaceae bacterium]